MKEAIERLRQKGYWQSRYRPGIEREDRLPDLLAVPMWLQRSAVNFRGWDFPHVGSNDPPVFETNAVWQETRWRHFHELWCAFRSGQLFHISGMRADYDAEISVGPMEEVPAGARVLGIGDALFRMTEFVHFSARYASAVCPGEPLRAELEVGGLTDRHLVIDNPGRGGRSAAYVYRSASVHRVVLDVPVGSGHAELGKRARELAMELFERFGFRTSDRLLEGWQSEMIYYRAGGA